MLTMSESIPLADRAMVLRASTFGFNLATLCAGVALFVTVARLARRRDAVPLIARLALAIFSGIFLATLFLALTEAPSARLQTRLMLGRAGGYMLMSLLCVVGLRARRNAMNLGFGLWASMVFASLVVLVLEVGQAGQLAASVKRYNECAWLLIPVAFAPHYGAFSRRGRWRTLAFTLATTVLLLAWQWALDEHYAEVLYGVLQLNALGEDAVIAYAPILGIVLGVTLAALTQPDPRDRMGGVALLLSVSAGHLPRSVGMMVVQMLAIALLCYSAWSDAPKSYMGENS